MLSLTQPDLRTLGKEEGGSVYLRLILNQTRTQKSKACLDLESEYKIFHEILYTAEFTCIFKTNCGK